MQNKIKKIFIFFVCFAMFICCTLPDDKIVKYTPMEGTITGVSTPKNIKTYNNYLFILDTKGLYMINLQMVDYDGDKLSEKDFIFKNDSTTYGDILNFDVSGDYVYIVTAKSSIYFIHKYTIYLDTYETFRIPGTKSVSHISITPDCLILSGNTNVAVKGINTRDASGDIIFDTTADYVMASDDKPNMTISPAKPVGIKTATGYDIYLLSMSSDQSGIRKYVYEPDVTSDNILLKEKCHLDLYPFDLTLMNSKDKLISSEQGRVAIYETNDFGLYSSGDKEPYVIPIDSENGALRTLEYNDKLIVLYGYKITANKYDKTAYDIYAYWCGAKIITNPYDETQRKIDSIIIDGWATDFAIYNDYLFVANQVKDCINIYKL